MTSMRMEMRPTLGLHQKLAPRMIQSMEILQLPIVALQERIEQEMEKNPVLELREKDPDVHEPKSPGRRNLQSRCPDRSRRRQRKRFQKDGSTRSRMGWTLQRRSSSFARCDR